MEKLQLRFKFGVKNNGWCCEGENTLKNGCKNGFGTPLNTYNVKAHFAMVQGFEVVFCPIFNQLITSYLNNDPDCFERFKNPSELATQWCGYTVLQSKSTKQALKIHFFVILKGTFVLGYGHNDKGAYTLKGSINEDQFTGELKYENDSLGLEGKMNDHKNKISGVTLMGSSIQSYNNFQGFKDGRAGEEVNLSPFQGKKKLKTYLDKAKFE